MAWATEAAQQHAYEQLATLPRGRLIEILAEWEMFERYSQAADFVWLSEWPKILAKVHARYERFTDSIQPVVMDVWKHAYEHQELDADCVVLCPYGCETHRVPFGEEE